MQKPSLFRPFLLLTAAAVLLTIMHLAASFLVPILLAIFFAMLLTPVYRWLKRIHIPAGLALILTVLFLVFIGVFLVLLVGNSMQTLANDLAQYSDQFSQRQAEIQSWLESHAQSVDVSQLTSSLKASNLTGILSAFLDAISSILTSVFVILFVIMFVLAEGPEFIRRMRKAFGEDHYLPRNVPSMVQMMISYFALRAVVNLVTATATGLMFWAFRDPARRLVGGIDLLPQLYSLYRRLYRRHSPGPAGLRRRRPGLGHYGGPVDGGDQQSHREHRRSDDHGQRVSRSPPPSFFFPSCSGCSSWAGLAPLIAMPLTMGILLFMGSFEETRHLVKAVIVNAEPAQNP